jgi:hypothetical protein
MTNKTKHQGLSWSRQFTCSGCRKVFTRTFTGAQAMLEQFCSDECRKKVYAWREAKRLEWESKRDDE